MSQRTPIPVPATLKWREFRYRVLPLITVSVTTLAVVALWITCVDAPTVIGKAVARKASVITPISGTLLTINVSKFEQVTEGDVLALIQPIGIKNQLDSLRLEIDLIRDRIDPIVEKKRNAVSYYRLRLEWLQQRVSLASSKVSLQRAENELARDKKLFDEKLISADRFDQSQKNVDALRAEVGEATNMVIELGSALDGLHALDAANNTDQLEQQLSVAVQRQEEHLKRLEEISEPRQLLAPMSGKVTSLNHVRGETIMDGDRVLVITAEESTQLIAYLKPPIPDTLTPGAPIRIQTRGQNRRTATTKVEGISPDWETLAQAGEPTMTTEFSLNIGLPVLLTLPPELKVRPGELVDIFLSP